MANIWDKIYSRLWWKNLPSTETPINDINLNKTDLAIDTLDDRVIELQTVKAEQSDLLQGVKGIEFNSDNGIFTITWFDGTVKTIDTLLEKIVTNWSYDPTTQKIILIASDGTRQEIDLSDFISVNEFVDTDTVGFAVGTDGKVQAIVKNGSITGTHLQPNYLADVTAQASAAAGSASSASSSENNARADALLAQSYAIGGTGVRTGEDTDNAKYYKEQAQAIAQLDDFTGATATTNGLRGLVPAPIAGNQDKYLKGDGTWGELQTGLDITHISKADWNALTPQEQQAGNYLVLQ